MYQIRTTLNPTTYIQVKSSVGYSFHQKIQTPYIQVSKKQRQSYAPRDHLISSNKRKKIRNNKRHFSQHRQNLNPTKEFIPRTHNESGCTLTQTLHNQASNKLNSIFTHSHLKISAQPITPQPKNQKGIFL